MTIDQIEAAGAQPGYLPGLRRITGSVTGAILLARITYFWRLAGSTPFPKFKEPCNSDQYKAGESWTEDLGFTRREFDTALGKLSDFVSYSRGMDRVTYYQLDEQALNQAINN